MFTYPKVDKLNKIKLNFLEYGDVYFVSDLRCAVDKLFFCFTYS